jgi:hypothetical protein
MNGNIGQISSIIKDFNSDLIVLKKKQADLLAKVKGAIYETKMADINKNLSR